MVCVALRDFACDQIHRGSSIIGTGIDLVGSASNASYSIALDGSPLPSSSYNVTETALASLNDLEDAHHTLLFTTIVTTPNTPNTFITFDEAIITYVPPTTAKK